MRKKLTITFDEKVHDGRYRTVGRRRTSRFIETVVTPHVMEPDTAAAYREMAADEARESEAGEWTESLVGDVADEPR